MRPLRSLWYRINYTDALIDRPRRLLLDWSAKAGCTLAIKMLFRYQGLLDEAEKFSEWVHDYRIRVYYANYGVATHRDLIDPGLLKVKVVRNPSSPWVMVVRKPPSAWVMVVGNDNPSSSQRRVSALRCTGP